MGVNTMKIGAAGLFLFLLILLLPARTQAQPNLNYDENRIDEIFSEWDRSDSPGCALGVYHNGEIIFSKGYGVASLQTNSDISPQTIFYAGSVSKQFAAAAIALLSLRGELDLDRPIRHYIPEMLDHPGNNDPTVRQVVHHTSGIPDLYSLLSLYDISLQNVVPFEEMVDVIAGQSHLNFEPGSDYMYSNSGYTLLAELVERVSGQSLREYTTENLFEPLGMNNTHFHDNRTHSIENQALSYQPSADEQFRLSYLRNFEGVGPGGLYTTIEDMLKWDQQLYENQLPNTEGFNELMHQRGVLSNGDTLSYAFALRISEYKGEKTVGHSGSFMGFKADYLRLPKHGYGSAILCNLGNIDPGSLNKELADVFLKDRFQQWLTRYEGTYYSETLGLEYTLSIQDDNLYLNRKTAPAGKLLYSGGNTFRTGGWEITFQESGQRNVKGFLISSGRAKNIFFSKRP